MIKSVCALLIKETQDLAKEKQNFYSLSKLWNSSTLVMLHNFTCTVFMWMSKETGTSLKLHLLWLVP